MTITKKPDGILVNGSIPVRHILVIANVIKGLFNEDPESAVVHGALPIPRRDGPKPKDQGNPPMTEAPRPAQLREAVAAFLKKWPEVEKRIGGMFGLQYARTGVHYDGPNIGAEIEAMREALLDPPASTAQSQEPDK